MEVSRRTRLCLELRGGVLRSLFLASLRPGLYGTESCLWPGEPKEHQEPTGRINTLWKACYERCERNERARHGVLCGTVPSSLPPHMLPLFLSHTHTDAYTFYYTHLTWRFTVQINSSSSSGLVQRKQRRAGPMSLHPNGPCFKWGTQGRSRKW